MIRAILASQLLIRLTTGSSLFAFPLPPSNSRPSNTNLTADRNRIVCRRHTDLRPLADFSTCIPSLFSLYATPLIHTVTIWDPGDFKLWGPESDLGGCYILVDGGLQRDVFAVESLLEPVIEGLNKCFVGAVEERNYQAAVRVGPGSVWWLSVGLETRRMGGSSSVS